MYIRPKRIEFERPQSGEPFTGPIDCHGMPCTIVLRKALFNTIEIETLDRATLLLNPPSRLPFGTPDEVAYAIDYGRIKPGSGTRLFDSRADPAGEVPAEVNRKVRAALMAGLRQASLETRCPFDCKCVTPPNPDGVVGEPVECEFQIDVSYDEVTEGYMGVFDTIWNLPAVEWPVDYLGNAIPFDPETDLIRRFRGRQNIEVVRTYTATAAGTATARDYTFLGRCSDQSDGAPDQGSTDSRMEREQDDNGTP